LDYWLKYGFVVGKNVASTSECNNVITKIHSILSALSMQLHSPETFIKDENNTPLLSRGFFELYHDDSLAQIRQNIRLYIYHSILWGTPYLWTTFDRIGIKPPNGENSQELPLHVDQNPTVDPSFTTIQGVLALEDCPVERGTFAVVPNSIPYFQEYKTFVKNGYKGEYVHLDEHSTLFEQLNKNKQLIPLQKGNIVSWDSRTTHANSSNISNIERYVFYISTGIAKNNEDIIKIRQSYYQSGLGINNREAYLHASKKPRFTNEALINSFRTPEKLSLLGECLYSIIPYQDIL